MLSFDVKRGADEAMGVAARVKLITHATSGFIAKSFRTGKGVSSVKSCFSVRLPFDYTSLTCLLFRRRNIALQATVSSKLKTSSVRRCRG